MKEKTIAVDLDGVIFEYDEWKGIDHFGKPMKGVRKSLRYLKYSLGYRIVIYTARANPAISAQYTEGELLHKILNILRKNNIPFDQVSTRKPIAEFYIDDRAVRFKSWPRTVRFIKRRGEA